MALLWYRAGPARGPPDRTIELPELDKDDAPGRRARRVVRRGRIADVRSGREIAMLVLEDAVKDQELLAAAVSMRGETTVRRVPDDRGGARHLIANAIQHPAVDAFHRRGDPWKPRGMDRDPLRKIRVDLHGSSRSPALLWRPTPNRLQAATGSIRLGSLFLTLPTRALTGQQIIPLDG